MPRASRTVRSKLCIRSVVPGRMGAVASPPTFTTVPGFSLASRRASRNSPIVRARSAGTFCSLKRIQSASPLIRPAVVMAALFTAIGGIQLFTEPKILDQASASITSTWTPNMFLQSVAFDRNDFGVAAAASILIALVAGGLSFVLMRIGNRGQS